jgi:hypothetical protein
MSIHADKNQTPNHSTERNIIERTVSIKIDGQSTEFENEKDFLTSLSRLILGSEY